MVGHQRSLGDDFKLRPANGGVQVTISFLIARAAPGRGRRRINATRAPAGPRPPSPAASGSPAHARGLSFLPGPRTRGPGSAARRAGQGGLGAPGAGRGARGGPQESRGARPRPKQKSRRARWRARAAGSARSRDPRLGHGQVSGPAGRERARAPGVRGGPALGVEERRGARAGAGRAVGGPLPAVPGAGRRRRGSGPGRRPLPHRERRHLGAPCGRTPRL